MKSQIHNVLMRHFPLTIGILLMLAVTSCGVLNVSISTPTQGEPKATPTPEAVVTEIFPETDEPPSPIDDQYVIPDRPLGSGPWLVFQSQGALWAINPDASGLTQLVGSLSILPAKFTNSVAPQGVGPMFQILFTHQPKIHDYRSFCKYVDRPRFQQFALALLAEGVYVSPSAALHSIASLAHTAEEVDFTLTAVRKVLNDSK